MPSSFLSMSIFLKSLFTSSFFLLPREGDEEGQGGGGGGGAGWWSLEPPSASKKRTRQGFPTWTDLIGLNRFQNRSQFHIGASEKQLLFIVHLLNCGLKAWRDIYKPLLQLFYFDLVWYDMIWFNLLLSWLGVTWSLQIQSNLGKIILKEALEITAPPLRRKTRSLPDHNHHDGMFMSYWWYPCPSPV